MFDFPTTPATGTTVTVPDGSFRVWDSTKWRAAPSANNLPPGGGGAFLPLTGGVVNGDVTITGSAASGHMDTLLTLTGSGSATFSLNAAPGKSVRLTLGGYSAGPPITTSNFTVNPGAGTTGNPFAILVGSGPGLHTVDMTQSLVKTKTNWINGSINGGAFDLTTSPLAIQIGATGALTLSPDPEAVGSSRSYLTWAVASDTASAGAGGLLSSARFIDIQHNWGGVGMSGGRVALNVHMNQVAPSGTPQDCFYGAGVFTTHGSYNQTGGDLTKYYGRNFPLTVAAGLQSGATNWYANIGCEWDNIVNAGASVARNVSQSFVLLQGHTNQGVYVDASLLWTSGGGPTGPGWRDLMLISDQMDFGWPLDEVNGSIMRVEVPNNPTAQPPIAKSGIDLSAAQFVGNAYSSRHFAVAGDGTTQHFNARIGKVTGGVSVDIPLKIGAFVSIANGGTGNDNSVQHWYRDNAEVPGLWLVSAVSGAGAVTAVSIIQPPYSTSSPATLTLTNTSAWVGGSCAVNVSWAANNTLSIQPSGGATVFGGPVNYTATGTLTPRSAQDRAADVVNVKDFGAVFDGASHPLSNYYPTLAAAQAVYPKATSLTNEIDGIAIQAALDFCAARGGPTNDYSYGGTVVLPNAKGLINTPLTISTSSVAIRAQGSGIVVRELVDRFHQTAPCHLLWTGAAVSAPNPCIYMLTIAVTDGLRRLAGCNVEGIFFDCNQVVGVSGVLLLSVVRSRYYFGVAEARGVPYTGAVLTAGSQNITVSSTAGIVIGQAITSPNSIDGGYVAAIINGTTIQASAQAVASATETVLIGGECVRLDCQSDIFDVNATQFNEFWLLCNQELGAQYSYGPCIVLNGSSDPGGGPSRTSYGNSCQNTFYQIYCAVVYGSGVVINNTDHNYFHMLGVIGLGGTPKGLVLNGSLSTKNGCCRYNVFDYVTGSVWSVGTDTGGFTTAAFGSVIRNLDPQNGGIIGAIGTDSNLALSNSAVPSLLSPLGGTTPVTAHFPDSTTKGGNLRGGGAVDLQTTRVAATQVASGATSGVLWGISNTASGQYSVAGGSANVSSGVGSLVFGISSSATASNAFALGQGVAADLFGCIAFSGGIIAGGRRAQNVKQMLRALSAANTTPVRLTADLLAASTINVCNLTAANQANAISVQLVATDSTDSANSYAWAQPLGIIMRDGGAASVTYTHGTPVTQSVGTTAGIVITEAADTTNGGYSLTFTPPTGNTAIWRVVATVEWTRVDGA